MILENLLLFQYFLLFGPKSNCPEPTQNAVDCFLMLCDLIFLYLELLYHMIVTEQSRLGIVAKAASPDDIEDYVNLHYPVWTLLVKDLLNNKGKE